MITFLPIKSVKSKRLLILSYVIMLVIFCFGGNICHSADALPVPKKTTMIGGWYNWDPYQYLATPSNLESLTGLDYELEKQIMERAGYQVNIQEVSWKQHNDDLEEGKRDFAMGAFTSERRRQYNYLTVPYRYEDNSVFVRRDDANTFDFNTSSKLIASIKENNYVIGVVDGYRYANDDLNKFIEDPENKKYIIKSRTDNDSMHLLISKRINAFLCDKIVGATIIWREKRGREISEIALKDSKAPVYMLLSKKSVSYEEFENINNVIKEYVESDDYKKIISWYLYPVLLMETVDSFWFYLIEILGMVSFAISGVIIAYRINATLLGTFLLALIPSFGGGILRDVIFGRYPIGFFISTTYIFLVLIVSILGFFSTRIFKNIKEKPRYGKIEGLSMPLQKHEGLLNNVLMITDAIGLAAFTVTGVIVCLLAKVSPLWIWGPFIAFLTGAGGGFIRDIIVKDVSGNETKIQALNGGLYGEISILWGALLSTYLYFTANEVDPKNIKQMVIVTITGAFLTRLAIYFFKIPNIKFIDDKLLD